MNNRINNNYVICGEVVRGDGLGRGAGMPTANVRCRPGAALPAHGVYASVTHAAGKEYRSLTHVGTRPTVDASGNVTVETHLLDYSGDLYAQEIKIELLEFIRETRKFDSLEEVRRQIDKDIQRANEIFVRML